jgi:gas vesicle protein
MDYSLNRKEKSMKGNVDSKLLLGLVIGGAVGAAVGYLVATDKKGQILAELNEVAAKAKNAFNSAVSKYRECNLGAAAATAGADAETESEA